MIETVHTSPEERLSNLISKDGQMSVNFRVSPQELALSYSQYLELQQITHACHQLLVGVHRLLVENYQEFDLQVSQLYRSTNCEDAVKKLAQREISPLDQIRPDITTSDEGFKVVEIETMIGGLGYISAVRDLLGESPDLDGIASGYTKLASEKFQKLKKMHKTSNLKPVIAVVITPHKMSIYRQEFEYLARVLSAHMNIHIVDPRQLTTDSNYNLYIKNQKVDLIHRFFRYSEFDGTHGSIKKGDLSSQDLRDLIKARDKLINAIMYQQVEEIQPWIEPLESKGTMALVHDPVLEDFWRETLGNDTYELLQETIPHTVFVNNSTPHINYQKMASNPRHRNGWLKPTSGWGARNQYRQSDTNSQFAQGLDYALRHPDTYIWQRDANPQKGKVCSWEEGKCIYHQLYLRINPFCFQSGYVSDIGITARKSKIVHGSSDSLVTVARIVSS